MKYKQLLMWTGAMLAVVSSLAYLIILYIIIAGFEIAIESSKLLIFLGLGAVNGVLVSLSLRIQGIAIAKNEEENKKVLKEYKELISQDDKEKFMPMWVFMLSNGIKDIVIKGLSIMVTLYFSITIIVEGIGDMNYFFLGLVNVILYFGFGILSLAKAYDHYNDNQIPLIKQKMYRLRKGVTDDAKQVKRDTEQEDRSVRERRGNQTLKGTESNSNGARRDSNKRQSVNE